MEHSIVNDQIRRVEFKFVDGSIPYVLQNLGNVEVARAPSIISTDYLDTHDLEHLYRSLDGEETRSQYRLRSYLSNSSGSIPSHLSAHIKVTSSTGDYKIVLPSEAACLRQILLARTGRQFFNYMRITYHRTYFKGPFGMRVTLDSNITSQYIGQGIGIRHRFNWASKVLEVKLPVEFKQRAIELFDFIGKEKRNSKIEQAAKLSGLIA